MLLRNGRATLLRSRNQNRTSMVNRLGGSLALPALLLAIALCAASPAQETSRPADETTDPVVADPQNDESGPPELSLGQQQQQIERDYERFEQKLLELGELMRGSDPDRAELLTQTRSQSRELRVLDQMRSIARLLTEGSELGDAVVRQEDLLVHIETLLKLLQSEDARDRNRKAIEEIEGYLQDLGRIIGEQKDARAATERGGESESLQSGQQRAADHAGELAEKIDRRDAERAAEKDAAESESENGEQQSPMPDEPSDGNKPGESPEGQPEQSPDGKPSQSQNQDSSEKPESKPSEGSPSQSPPQSPSQSPSQPQQGSPSQPQQQPPGAQPQPSPGQQSPPQPGEQQSGEQQGEPQSEQTPGRQELQQALDNMNRAIEELKQQNRDGASDEQDAALANLEQMKARLEEILRQLREEEREMVLTMLEARFQEMLRVQLQINSETERLDKVDAANRESQHAARATDLARTQRDNALDADRALVLLKEEGSSVAFPEAVEQMRDSMQTVATRLDRTDTGETTQLIEQIIVETLDEMILALQQELEKMKEQQQQPQQPQQPQDQDQSLVNALAELKMIRSLQNQINRLTRQVGLEIDGEQADSDDTLQLLRDLARRQQRVQEATYDLTTGKSSLGQELRRQSP
ncbi:MAG: hypothetical protein JNG89_02320 [Planctomycetaceae bacterium]|nr:hypothetical protein [Planctomycetaceae bacterium]